MRLRAPTAGKMFVEKKLYLIIGFVIINLILKTVRRTLSTILIRID